MKITLQNYEEYFVRLIDDELSVVEASEVQLFLQQHPELQTDLDAFRMAILQPDVDFTFPEKLSSNNRFMKAILKSTFHDWWTMILPPMNYRKWNILFSKILLTESNLMFI